MLALPSRRIFFLPAADVIQAALVEVVGGNISDVRHHCGFLHPDAQPETRRAFPDHTKPFLPRTYVVYHAHAVFCFSMVFCKTPS